MGWRYTVTIPANCTVALCLPGKEAVTLESGTYSFCGESMEIEKILSQMTLEDKIALCSGANFWQTKKYEQYGIASLFMCDGPHGLRKQESDSDALGLGRSVPATCFPTAFWRGTPVSSTGKSLLRKGTMHLRIVSEQTLSNIFRMQLTTV